MKIVSGLLLFVMALMTPLSMNFEQFEIKECSTNEQILEENGMDYETISKLSEYTKERLVEQIHGSEAFQFEVAVMSFDDQTDDNATRGQIPDEDIVLIITSEIAKVEDNEIKEIKVRVYYEWQRIPLFKFQDPIAIDWDNEKFTYKPGSFYSEDRYSTNSLEGALHVSRQNYYAKNENTLCWYADLREFISSDFVGHITGLYGFGEIILEPNEGYQYYGKSNVGVTYIHRTLTINAGISLGATVGFEIPIIGNDQISTSIRVDWNQPIYLTPADYGYEQQYFYYEKNTTDHYSRNNV